MVIRSIAYRFLYTVRQSLIGARLFKKSPENVGKRALAERGDNASISRRVDHWAYFPDPESRDAFASWASKNGFFIESPSQPDGEANDEYGVQLFHTATVELSEITRTTLRLMKAAGELGGAYDGWETSVEKIESGGSNATG